MTPSLIAFARAVPGTGDIVRINFRLGWTGTGWARALSMALVHPPVRSPAPQDPVSWRARLLPGHLDVPWRPGAQPTPTQAGPGPGEPAEGGPQPTAARPATSAAPYHAGGLPVSAGQPNGVAVAGMVLGILAVVFEWFGLITLALAIAAVVLGAVGASRSAVTGTGRRQGVAGVALGIIGLAAYLFWGAISAGILWFI